jgi:hypothetical protein
VRKLLEHVSKRPKYCIDLVEIENSGPIWTNDLIFSGLGFQFLIKMTSNIQHDIHVVFIDVPETFPVGEYFAKA